MWKSAITTGYLSLVADKVSILVPQPDFRLQLFTNGNNNIAREPFGSQVHVAGTTRPSGPVTALLRGVRPLGYSHAPTSLGTR